MTITTQCNGLLDSAMVCSPSQVRNRFFDDESEEEPPTPSTSMTVVTEAKGKDITGLDELEEKFLSMSK